MTNVGPARGHVYPIVRKARLQRAHLGAQCCAAMAWLRTFGSRAHLGACCRQPWGWSGGSACSSWPCRSTFCGTGFLFGTQCTPVCDPSWEELWAYV